ncbi:sensor histidine kinase [Vreelandella utahensis]|uniref:sensor histidine kinase n=1 Tax=Vreelandella halophila TaxID=86177 RepID=UPI0009844FDE|nr:ATP-binding protein [Halomonas utahensis]
MSQQTSERNETASHDSAAADANDKVTSLFGARQEPETGPVDEALELFNQMSRQITDSYRTLEERVNELAGRLSSEERRRRDELEEREKVANRLSTLLDVLPAGVVVLDSQGVISQCNPAAVELLDEPLEGERWVDVIQRAFAPRRDDGHEVSLNDGRRVNIEIRSMDNEPGQLILLTDLTETRELQSRLARSERLSSMGRMVASLAHQIRTPLSAAMLYAGHLYEEDLDAEMRERCAGKLMARLQHLEQQVRDMLIFARGDIRLAEQLGIGEWIQAVVQNAETPLQTRGATLTTPGHWPEGTIACNREALVGACLNLINNSLEAGANELALEVSGQDGEVRFCITDNGPGLSAEEAERVTEAFVTTKSHGTGLGLAVVKAVVQAHKGRFELVSDGRSGTSAIITLPLAAPHKG